MTMKTTATLVFVCIAGYGFSQEKNTTNGVTVPQPQQLQNNGLNSTRSNKEQRYAPAAPAPGSAAPASSAAPAEIAVPDSSKAAPVPSGIPMTGKKD